MHSYIAALAVAVAVAFCGPFIIDKLHGAPASNLTTERVPRIHNWTSEEIQLPRALMELALPTGRSVDRLASPACATGEPVEPLPLEIDEAPESRRGRPFGIVVGDEFLSAVCREHSGEAIV